MFSIDFNLYNSDTKLVTVCRFMIEFLPTGLFLTSQRTYTFKILLYDSTADLLRAAGEVIILAGCLYYLLLELRQLCKSRPVCKYFHDAANAFDLLLQACMICCIIYWIYHIQNVEKRLSLLSNGGACDATSNDPTAGVPIPGAAGGPACFEDMYPFAQNFNYAITFAGTLGFLMSMKFFKYFSISRRMNTLWLTLARAANSLLAFAIGFCMMVAGFSFMGQMIFGSMVAGFHTFEASFSTLLQYPLGNFDYSQLSAARPDMAPVFFALYMALVFLVCMNMMVAIITIAFDEVNVRLKSEDKWKHAGRTFEQHHLAKCGVRFRACLRRTTFGRLGGDGVDELILESEGFYLRLMSRFIDAAEEHSRVDLLRYVEDVTKACPPGSNLYMGINELCSLARNMNHPTDAFCGAGHREIGSTKKGGLLSPNSRAASGSQLGQAGNPWYACCACCRSSTARPSPPLVSASSPARSTASNTSSVYVSVSNPLAAPNSARQAAAAGAAGKRLSATLGSPRRGATPEQLAAEVTAAEAGALTAADLLRLHGHRCTAWQVVHAYYSYKDVTCLGKTDRHQFWGDGVKALSKHANGKNGTAAGANGSDLSASSNVKGSWKVVKTNRSNAKQERIVSIESDKERYLLTCRDAHLRLKRRFPLSQIVQVEASLPHPARCYLYIEAAQPGGEGQGGWDSYLAVTQDTVYDLTFPGGETDRNTFLDLVTALRTEASKEEAALFEAALGGRDAARAARRLFGDGVTAESVILGGAGGDASRRGSMRSVFGGGGGAGAGGLVTKRFSGLGGGAHSASGGVNLGGGGSGASSSAAGGGGGGGFMALLRAAQEKEAATQAQLQQQQQANGSVAGSAAGGAIGGSADPLADRWNFVAGGGGGGAGAAGLSGNVSVAGSTGLMSRAGTGSLSTGGSAGGVVSSVGGHREDDLRSAWTADADSDDEADHSGNGSDEADADDEDDHGHGPHRPSPPSGRRHSAMAGLFQAANATRAITAAKRLVAAGRRARDANGMGQEWSTALDALPFTSASQRFFDLQNQNQQQQQQMQAQVAWQQQQAMQSGTGGGDQDARVPVQSTATSTSVWTSATGTTVATPAEAAAVAAAAAAATNASYGGSISARGAGGLKKERSVRFHPSV